MSRVLILTLLSLTTFQLGCGSDSSFEVTPVTLTPQTQIKRATQTFQLQCGTEKCSPSVGMLLSQNAKGTAICTTFVAGEYQGKTVMATNHHCLRDFIDSSGKTCRGEVSVQFPDAPSGSFRCERILSHSASSSQGEFTFEQDYALFLLDRKIQRPPLKWNVGPVPDETPVFIHSVIKTSENQFEIRSQECSSYMGSILNPYYLDDPHSSLLLFYGCRQPPGTSGSPVVNQDGEVIGILQASATEGKKSDWQWHQDPFLAAIFGNIDMPQVSLGTRAGCVRATEIGLRGDHPSCQITETVSYDQQFERWTQLVFNGLPEEIDSQIRDDVLDWILSEMNILVFQPKTSHQLNPRPGVVGEDIHQVEPFCFIHPNDSDWLEKYKTSDETGYSKEARFTVPIPEWTLVLSADRIGRLELELIHTIEDWTFTFDASELEAEGATQVQLEPPPGQTTHRAHAVRVGHCDEGVRETLRSIIDLGRSSRDALRPSQPLQ